jgi:hypothetical protein
MNLLEQLQQAHPKARSVKAFSSCIPGFLRNEWTHAFKVLHA